MAGNAAGGIRGAARRLGLTEEAYRARLAAGEKWCEGCAEWHPRAAFGADRTRRDGLASRCLVSARGRGRAAYVPHPEPSRAGRRYATARDGDHAQARGRVNSLVNAGLLPDPNDRVCTDCGHERGTADRRHEYDHHLGYAAEHHEHVQPVCAPCHLAREIARGVRYRDARGHLRARSAA